MTCTIHLPRAIVLPVSSIHTCTPDCLEIGARLKLQVRHVVHYGTLSYIQPTIARFYTPSNCCTFFFFFKNSPTSFIISRLMEDLMKCQHRVRPRPWYFKCRHQHTELSVRFKLRSAVFNQSADTWLIWLIRNLIVFELCNLMKASSYHAGAALKTLPVSCKF